ncbi:MULTISPECIES: hypothetical protein [Cytobacillus]|nr:hypothetical protein [Cytobacillus firmus]
MSQKLAQVPPQEVETVGFVSVLSKSSSKQKRETDETAKYEQ